MTETRVALITGAGSGIGRETALALAAKTERGKGDGQGPIGKFRPLNIQPHHERCDNTFGREAMLTKVRIPKG